MKKLINAGFVSVLLIATSCTKEPLRNSTSTYLQSPDNATQKIASHQIGERFGGGIIFALNSTGTRGLIADTVDLPAVMWWNGTNIVTEATEFGVGKGPSNTRKIILAQGTTVSYAALECARSTRSGYTDWFLPSRDELHLLYKKRFVVGGFGENQYYWSSSECVSTNQIGDAIAQPFGFDLALCLEKNFIYNVRAIRAF